jgi:hypothetical protein
MLGVGIVNYFRLILILWVYPFFQFFQGIDVDDFALDEIPRFLVPNVSFCLMND